MDHYAKTVDWLYRLEVARGWDLKLDSVRRALEVLGHPHQAFPSLHVGGTNGKGSTAAIAHSILMRRGMRVGLYTSPHLNDFCERICITGEPIEKAAVVALTAEMRQRLHGSGIELTFFEFTTILAFLYFARRGVEAAVVEVGLGGRLDATNVIRPRAAAITTVALDHERYLGSTVSLIGGEKAGIFKAGVPAVVGSVDGEAGEVLVRVARDRGSPLRMLGRDFRVERKGAGFDYFGKRELGGLHLGLRGRFQIDNAAVALAALEETGWLAGVADETIRRGLAEACWPGRLEVISERPMIVLDGAHNPAGIESLAAELAALANGRPVHLIFGVLSDKRWDQMARHIVPHITDAVIVPVPERRSEEPRQVARLFSLFVPTRTEVSGAAAVSSLVERAENRDSLIVVAGSLFLVGEVRQHLVDELASRSLCGVVRTAAWLRADESIA